MPLKQELKIAIKLSISIVVIILLFIGYLMLMGGEGLKITPLGLLLFLFSQAIVYFIKSRIDRDADND